MIYQYRLVIKTLILSDEKRDLPTNFFAITKKKQTDRHVFAYYERHIEAAHDIRAKDEVQIGDLTKEVLKRTYIIDPTNSGGGVMSLWLGAVYMPSMSALAEWEGFDQGQSDAAVQRLLSNGFKITGKPLTDFWERK